MPSRRHNSAMLDSPRKPSSTMRIFSSDECRLRVARRMFFSIRSDGDSGCTFLGVAQINIWGIDVNDWIDIDNIGSSQMKLTKIVDDAGIEGVSVASNRGIESFIQSGEL